MLTYKLYPTLFPNKKALWGHPLGLQSLPSGKEGFTSPENRLRDKWVEFWGFQVLSTESARELQSPWGHTPWPYRPVVLTLCTTCIMEWSWNWSMYRVLNSNTQVSETTFPLLSLHCPVLCPIACWWWGEVIFLNIYSPLMLSTTKFLQQNVVSPEIACHCWS